MNPRIPAAARRTLTRSAFVSLIIIALVQRAETGDARASEPTSHAAAHQSTHRAAPDPPTPESAELVAYHEPWLLWWSGRESRHILQNTSTDTLRRLPRTAHRYFRPGVLQDGTVVYAGGAKLHWIKLDAEPQSESMTLCGTHAYILKVFEDGIIIHTIDDDSTNRRRIGSVYFVPFGAESVDKDARFLLFDSAPHYSVYSFARHGNLLAATYNGTLGVFDLDDRSVRMIPDADSDVCAIDRSTAIFGGGGAYDFLAGKRMECELPTCQAIVAFRYGVVYYWVVTGRARHQQFELRAAYIAECNVPHRTLLTIHAGYSGTVTGRQRIRDVLRGHPSRVTEEGLLIWNEKKWTLVPW